MSTSETWATTDLDEVERVRARVSATGVAGALIGGVAVSAIGRPRATRDVDVVVWMPSRATGPGSPLR
jgi:hypothetical protein